MKAMVYIQSGGPTAVINTSFYGAIMEAKKNKDKISHIYGSRFGIEGLINDDLIDIDQESDEDIELLKQTPGSILGTTRYKLPKDLHSDVYKKIIDTIRKYNIGYVFVNGGNDSMDTCYKLSLLCNELNIDCKIMGVPKTVDNDLACTDHSLGFPSAAKHVVNNIQSICIDASCYRQGKVHVIEVMGRNAGWLTAACDLLDKDIRPDFIYLPENKFDVEQFIKDVKKTYDQKGHVVAVISEGIQFERDMSNVRYDGFGHAQLGGVAEELARRIENSLDISTRAIELSLIQRADPIFISKVDREEAIAIGSLAVKKALEGQSGKMIALIRDSNCPYKSHLEVADLSNIANEERRVPNSMMKDNSMMDDTYKEYLKPLITGEVDILFSEGIMKRSHFKYIKVR